MAQIKNITILNGGEDVKQQKLLFIAGVNKKFHNHFGRQLVVLGN